LGTTPRGAGKSLNRTYEGRFTLHWGRIVAGLEGHVMRSFFLAAAICLAASACQTPQQTAGTTTGVVAGAVVGGPVGAVVGGVAGAAVTAPGGPLSPGYCYVQNRRGQLLYDRAGQPLVRRCA